MGGDILLDAGRVTMLDEAALLEACRDAADRLMQRAGIAWGRAAPMNVANGEVCEHTGAGG